MLCESVTKYGNVNIFDVSEGSHLLYGVSKVLDYVEKGLRVLYINGVDDRKDITDMLLKYNSLYKENIKLKTLAYLIFDNTLKIYQSVEIIKKMDKCVLVDYDAIIVDTRDMGNKDMEFLKMLGDYTSVFVIN